jgi:hypothetical protein
MTSVVRKGGGFLIGAVVGAFISMILTTFFQKRIDDEYSELWLLAFAEPIVFESTKVSGCSGGDLGRLVQTAQKNGLQVDSQISNSFLCASWDDKAYPRRILEDIATRFDKCFTMDRSQTTPIMKLRATNTAICTANVELDETNQWKQLTSPKYLCYSEMPATPKMTACTPAVLKSLGFQK